MTKRIFALLLAVIMVVTMLPMTAMAVGEVAEVNGTLCESLADAIDKAPSGATVTLLANVDESVTVSKTITLDLNGNSISSAESSTILVTNGSLTVTDNSTDADGAIQNTSSYGDAVSVKSGGSFAMDKGNISGDYGIFVYSGANTVNIYGGSVIATYVAVYMESGIAYISGGTFSTTAEGDDGHWVICSDEPGDIVVTGGTFSRDIPRENYRDKDNYGFRENADGTFTVYKLEKNIYIGETAYTTLAIAFAAAKENDIIEIRVAGDYEWSNTILPANVTIVGTVDGVVLYATGRDDRGLTLNNLNNANKTTFKNIDFNAPLGNGKGAYVSNGSIEAMTFENCSFTGLYAFQVDSANNAVFTFTNCVFNGFTTFASTVKEINVSGGEINDTFVVRQDTTIDDVTFSEDAVVQLGTSDTVTDVEVTITDCTVEDTNGDGDKPGVADLIVKDDESNGNSVVVDEEAVIGTATTYAVTFTVPTGATIEVKDSKGTLVLDANDDDVYEVENGKTYTYTVSKTGYVTKTGRFTVKADDQTIEVDSLDKDSFTISFDTKGAGYIAPITVEYGAEIPTLPTPFRQGYEFTGWLGIPSVMPAEDITLTATWRQTYFQIDTPVKPVTPVTPVTPVVPSEPEVEDDSCDGKLSSGCAAATFADLDSSAWYHDAVDYALENGLMQGVGDGKFAPYTTTSRAMIVTILYRLEGEPVVGSANSFSDVKDGEWYTDAIIWAAENEIVLGYDGAFMPEDDVTAEQLMLILQRYAEYKGADEITVPMIAPYEYNTWAEAGVVWAYLNDILEIGIDVDDLTQDATRVELAAYLYNFCVNFIEK